MFIGVWADGQFMEGKWVSARARLVVLVDTHTKRSVLSMCSKQVLVLEKLSGFVLSSCVLCCPRQVHQDGTTFNGSFDKSIPVSLMLS